MSQFIGQSSFGSLPPSTTSPAALFASRIARVSDYISTCNFSAAQAQIEWLLRQGVNKIDLHRAVGHGVDELETLANNPQCPWIRQYLAKFHGFDPMAGIMAVLSRS